MTPHYKITMIVQKTNTFSTPAYFALIRQLIPTIVNLIDMGIYIL